MIGKTEKQQILSVIQSPQFRIIEQVAKEFCDKLSREPVVGDSQWETIKTAVMTEGKIRGINDFISELYNLAQKSNE